MLKKNINVWTVSLNSPLEDFEGSYLERLYKHGCAVFLTDSFLLLRPLDALRVCLWFRLVVLPTKFPHSWKLFFRPNIRTFFLSLQEERVTKEDIEVYAALYAEIVRLCPMDMVIDCGDEDGERREHTRLEADICSPYDNVNFSQFDEKVGRHWLRSDEAEKNMEGIRNNDEYLSTWFSRWGMVKNDQHRRFHVLTGSSKEGDPVDQWFKELVDYENGPWNHVSYFPRFHFSLECETCLVPDPQSTIVHGSFIRNSHTDHPKRSKSSPSKSSSRATTSPPVLPSTRKKPAASPTIAPNSQNGN